MRLSHDASSSLPVPPHPTAMRHATVPTTTRTPPPAIATKATATATAATIAPLLSRWAVATGQAVAQWSARTYALPDKTVASQVLMYRQLLHTPCKPGLKLSRPYEGTPAQVSVAHMPWWETIATPSTREDGTVVTVVLGMKDTRKMVISYDNLIARLWIKGTKGAVSESTNSSGTELSVPVLPVSDETDTIPADSTEEKKDESTPISPPLPRQYEGLPLPPIPHDFWVSQLGFQQKDPVTDFRSGGVLSLAMMVWIVESCPDVYARFDRNGTDPAAVLPFGITSINVTDMMAKFLMLSKNTDRMDALLSQKPFWSMFSDPYALLTCQELALDMLADVVAELVAVRRAERMEQPVAAPSSSSSSLVTVFDFTHILSVTETRVEHDLLGAGPLSVADLRRIHGRLQCKYQTQLQAKLDRIVVAARRTKNTIGNDNDTETFHTNDNRPADTATSSSVIASPLASFATPNTNAEPAAAAAAAAAQSPLLHETIFAHATTGVVGAVTATGFLANAVLAQLNPRFGGGVGSSTSSHGRCTTDDTTQTSSVSTSAYVPEPDIAAPSNKTEPTIDDWLTPPPDASTTDPFSAALEGDWIGPHSTDAHTGTIPGTVSSDQRFDNFCIDDDFDLENFTVPL